MFTAASTTQSSVCVLQDSNGNPIFVDASGSPLVDAQGRSLFGRNGEIIRDRAGNPRAYSPIGNVPVTDANGNPVFLNPGGEWALDSNGTSVIGRNGVRKQDEFGNMVQRDDNGVPMVDQFGNPIYIGPTGAHVAHFFSHRAVCVLRVHVQLRCTSSVCLFIAAQLTQGAQPACVVYDYGCSTLPHQSPHSLCNQNMGSLRRTQPPCGCNAPAPCGRSVLSACILSTVRYSYVQTQYV